MWRESARIGEGAGADHWLSIYRILYANADVRIEWINDRSSQLAQVDALIHVPNRPKPIASQHKNRPHSSCYDVALEYEHQGADGRKWPGWIELDGSAELFVYACHQDKMAFCCGYGQLKRAWLQNKERWIAQFRDDDTHRSSTNNKGYETLFCPVPVQELGQYMRIRLVDFDMRKWVAEYESQELRAWGSNA